MCKYVIVTLLYLTISFNINAEIFSSTSKVELLLTTQKNIIDVINNLMKTKNVKNKILKNHLLRFESEHQEAMKDIPRYIGNPVNAYRLIKRLTVDIKLIEKVLIAISEYKRNTSFTYPSRDDLKGAVHGLLHIEFVYDFKISDMAAGLWNTSHGGKAIIEKFNPMTISDCYEISKVLYNVKIYEKSVQWSLEARKKYNNDWRLYPEDSHIQLEDIIKLINKGYTSDKQEDFNFNNFLREISFKIPDIQRVNREVIVTCFKNGLKGSEAVEYIKNHLNYLASHPVMNKAYQNLNNTFNSLCKGEINNQEKVHKNAKCYFARGPHPFLKLAPIKAELLNRAPLLILFHNVISDSEIKELKDHSFPRFKRGPITPIDTKINLEYSRICQGAEALGNESLAAARIKTRIEQFSGMKLTSSEELQVVNYGIGGHCGPHHDYWDNDMLGERIATALFYLSDVELGGATVFPILGTAVFPVKGAALYWVNLLASGQGDRRTFHAACPVLRGSKWTLTQWINLREQELDRPCPLNSNPTPNKIVKNKLSHQRFFEVKS